MEYSIVNTSLPLTFAEASCSDGSTLTIWIKGDRWGLEKDSRNRWERPHGEENSWRGEPGWNLNVLTNGLEGVMDRGGMPISDSFHTADDLYLAVGRFALSLGVIREVSR